MQISCLGFNSLMETPRRVSPRFQNLQHNLQRRVSPRFHNLRNGGNSNFRKTRNVGNLNFEKICNSTNSGKTSNTRVSPNSKIEKMCSATNSTETSNTRGSLSFQNLPIVEIWDATDSRNASNTRVSPRFQSLLNPGNSNTEKMQNVLDSRKISDMRVSPGLQSIPLEKRPYYGSCQNRKTLNDSHGNSNIEKIHNVLDSRKTSNTRVSPRFQSIPLEKRPYYGSCQKRKTSDASQDTLMVKKQKSGNAEVECVSNGSITIENGEKDAARLRETGTKGGNSGDDIASIHGTSAAMVVKDKLRLFNKYFLRFSKKEDACEGNAKQSKCQGHFKLSKCKGHAKQSKPHPDLMAISEMLKKNEVLCHKKYFGDLPGIEVGHCFYFRAEMVALGLHKLLLKGIDYIGSPCVKSEYSGYTFPLACAIVLSDQYEDDFDISEEIVYTGEGGNDLFVGKHQFKDQVMLRGNLALKNNKEQSMPVRVIRGHKCDDSYSKTLYIYDGLYKVTDYWDEKGISGFKVFKYRLKRFQGPDNLTNRNQVHFVQGKVSRVNEELPGLIYKDISNGQEDICIPVFNLYSSTVAPTGFKYIKSIQVAKNVSIPPDAPGCKCRGKCTNPKSCSCAKLNGGDFPYVSQDGGRLFEAKDVVFECGPNCGCGPECANRASQKGLKYHLEVYRTEDEGWAVRSSDFIPSGAPVCEYVGILRKNYELEDISGNDYIFEIDCWHTMKGIGGRERRLGDVSLPMPHLVNEDEETLESEPEPEFCIDGSSFGNVARFINHSCDPNLFVQCVLSSHHDVRLARIVLFAADDIPRMQELTYDYNYAIDSVVGPDGKTKQLPCFCGTDECRKRLY